VGDLQSADERECRDILTAVENFGHLDLEVAGVGLEIVTLPHFDGEEVVIVLFGFSSGSILSEECLSYLLRVLERMSWQGV